MEGTIAEVRMFAGNFSPRNWAFCSGQILPIAQNTALFSLLGTTYGGNGQTTFALPDLRGRAVIGTGQGPGLSNKTLGELAGTPSLTLNTNNLPSHTHAITGSAAIPFSSHDGHSTEAVNNFPAISGNMIYSSGTDNNAMAPASVALTTGLAGGGQPVNNMKPYLGMNYIICLFGIYPSRN